METRIVNQSIFTDSNWKWRNSKNCTKNGKEAVLTKKNIATSIQTDKSGRPFHLEQNHKGLDGYLPAEHEYI